MSRVPLTAAAFGSTRCPGCEKRFTATPDQPVTEYQETEMYTRKGSVSLGETRQVIRRWHTACRDAAERFGAESRARAAAQHEADVRAMCEAAGLDYDTVKAEHDRRQAEREGEL